MRYINALGKQCPMPVVMAKKEIDSGLKEFVVAVDNETAVENLKRLAANSGMSSEVLENEGHYKVHFKEMSESEKEQACVLMPELMEKPKDYVMFFGKNYVGEGAFELGFSLIKMMLYTLAESENLPSAVLFMNSGVKIPSGDDEQTIESLKTLESKGCQVLVCGTCLNYYGVMEKLKAGQVSNMYDILGKMQEAGKVITV